MRNIYNVEITNEEIICTLESTIPNEALPFLFTPASSVKKIYKIDQIVGAKISQSGELILMQQNSSNEIYLAVENSELTKQKINDRVKSIWGKVRISPKDYISQIKSFEYLANSTTSSNVNNNSSSSEDPFISYLESTNESKEVIDSSKEHKSKKRKIYFDDKTENAGHSEEESDDLKGFNDIGEPKDGHIHPIFLESAGQTKEESSDLKDSEEIGAPKDDDIDPILKEIKKEFESINDRHSEKFKKDYRSNPESFLWFRYSDAMTRIEPGFENYPAAKIPIFLNKKEENFNILSEGPNLKNLGVFLSILHREKINIIVASGEAHDKNGNEKFYNYMEHATEITALEFLKASEVTNDTYPPNLNDTSFKFYKYNSMMAVFYVVHIPTWKDHSLPEFTFSDIQFLACFLKIKGNACYHCSAGIGRSVTLLITEMVLKREIFMEDKKTFLEGFYTIIEEVKEKKPCVGELHQLQAVLGVAEDLYEEAVALKLIQPTNLSNDNNNFSL